MKGLRFFSKISLAWSSYLALFEIYGMNHDPNYQQQLQYITHQPQAQVIGQQVESSRGQNEEQSYNQVKSTIMQQKNEEDDGLPSIKWPPLPKGTNFLNTPSLTNSSSAKTVLGKSQNEAIQNEDDKPSLKKKPKPPHQEGRDQKLDKNLRVLSPSEVESLKEIVNSLSFAEKAQNQNSELKESTTQKKT